MAGHAAPAQICLKNTYLGNCINAETIYLCLHTPYLDLLCNEFKKGKADLWNAMWHLTVAEFMFMDLGDAETLCWGFLHEKG